MRYAADLIGIDHVALGSDFDGSVKTPFDATRPGPGHRGAARCRFQHDEIAKVMGGNQIRFLLENLPD